MSCWRTKKPSLVKQELPTAKVFSVWGPTAVSRKAPAGRTQEAQPQSSPQLLGPGNGCIRKVTAACEKWGQGWRQGQAVMTAFLPHFSLAAANWQSQLILSSLSLPCGFAYAAEQTGASFVFCSSCENMICCPRINFDSTVVWMNFTSWRVVSLGDAAPTIPLPTKNNQKRKSQKTRGLALCNRYGSHTTPSRQAPG